MEMPAAFVTAINDVDFEFNSARPNAPVVPHVEKPQRGRVVREALARGLSRAAVKVRPSRAAV
ncbi:hypothetical protein O7606_00170 [Micromonospora sp. WMMD882]|uniref:hypothetical protein n=1 Tax=Micromonospora sp. WMMD882 TaxID=3015151 RepID=UPI00248D3167|nr:hypothetical protein [Micromonospora sp. WMMD882]WBB79867.1 hypothetical protein O7606_00170 [Micromonospora sp. WMMD882]